MARVSQLQTNFTAGELSNRLWGRPDLAKYKNGAETLENIVVFPHGGASRRSGSKFVKEVNINIPKMFDVVNSMNSKTSFGGTSAKNVKRMIAKYKKELK